MLNDKQIDDSTDRAMAYRKKFMELVRNPEWQKIGTPVELALGMAYALGEFISAGAVMVGKGDKRVTEKAALKLTTVCGGMVEKAVNKGLAVLFKDVH